VPQFRFSKINGPTVVIQDWSTDSSIQLSNTVNGDNYGVEVRCSSDTSCTTALVSPPLGTAGCAPPGIRMADPPIAPCTGNNSVAGQCLPGFTAWNFAPNCAPLLGGAPALICATLHNWEHHNDPDGPPAGQVCHARLPALWGNSFISTGTLPGVWGPIAGAICNTPVPALFSPNSCDISPVGFLTVPPGPVPADITCGDPVAPPPGTVTYYLAGYHTLVSGAACTSPVPAPPASVVNIDYAGATDCYRWDDDATVGGAFAPVLSAGCP
jgi:hypothetical protein